MKDRSNAPDSASLDELYETLRVDLDQLRLHENTLVQFTTPELGAKIRQFIEDHERHVREIGDLIHQKKSMRPDNLHALIKHHRDQERRNLEFIQQALHDAEASIAKWEGGGSAPSSRH